MKSNVPLLNGEVHRSMGGRRFYFKKKSGDACNYPPGNDHISPYQGIFEDDVPFPKVDMFRKLVFSATAVA